MTRLRWLLAAPALLLATTGPSIAADLRDKAGLFSAEAVKKAEAEMDRISKEYSVPVAIETVDSLEGRSIEDVLPQHAKAADAKGLYILITKKEHKIEAGTAKSFAKYLTRARDIAIRDTFTREFKGGNFDEGLAKGLDKVDSTLSEARAEAGGTLRPTTTAPATRRGNQAQAPVGPGIPGKPSSGGMGMLLTIGLGLLALFIVIRILGAIFGGGNRGYANNQRMMGPGGGGMGGPGYGPGYGGGGGGGGGGFMSSMFGGIGGALAGNWLYDQFSGRHHDSSLGSNYDPNAGGVAPQEPAGPDYVTPGDGGGDWGGGGADAGGGGGDWGGGGADAGGGGGDWGGGGGGDWGGGGGGDDGGSW